MKRSISDVEVPEIVQSKAQLAFSEIKNERVKEMRENQNGKNQRRKGQKKKNMYRPVIAAAACALIALLAGGFLYNRDLKPADDAPDMADAANVDEEAFSNETAVSHNPFVLNVLAAESEEKAELEKGVPVVVNSTKKNTSYVLSADEESGCSYCINLPLSCEGEDIDSVTYRINKGAFQVIEKEGESIVISGIESEEKINAGQIGGGWDEKTDEQIFPATIKYYTEYTLDYKRQNSETTWINMVRDKIRVSDYMRIWGEDSTAADIEEGYNEMVDGVVITCTVNFNDGTHESVELEAGAVSGTARELGVENAVEPDVVEVFFTLERKDSHTQI